MIPRRVLELLAGVSTYLAGPARANGVLVCPRHRIEHTAKNARSIVVDCILFRETGEERYLERARRRAQRTLARRARDPEHGAWIYLPARHDARNISTSVIDSGEATDALATLLLMHGDRLEQKEQQAIEQAITENAATYLACHAPGKEITNQRLWGAMGLAAAYRLLGRPEWRSIIWECLERSLDEQHADGSWPYHPAPEQAGIHPGIRDITSYYQSRCLAFAHYALECLGSAQPEEAARRARLLEALRRGTEFLLALHQPDGRKSLLLEAKRWFWEAPDESGSFPYDIFAFLRAWELWEDERYRTAALVALEQVMQHQQRDGSLAAHAGPDRDFVCPIFHTADAAWIARVAHLLPITDEPAEYVPPGQPHRRVFPQAGLVRYDDAHQTLLVRTARQPMNLLYGTALAGASVVYYGRADCGWRNLVHPRPEQAESEGSFALYPLRPRPVTRLREFLAQNRLGRDLRLWLFVLRLELAAGRTGTAALRLWRRVLRPLLAAPRGVLAAHWALTGELEERPQGLRATVRPARWDGTVDVPATLLREYDWSNGRLRVHEELTVEQGLRCAVYIKPAHARAFQIKAGGPVIARGVRLVLLPSEQGRLHVSISYELG